jgi:hypothetical protein
MSCRIFHLCSVLISSLLFPPSPSLHFKSRHAAAWARLQQPPLLVVGYCMKPSRGRDLQARGILPLTAPDHVLYLPLPPPPPPPPSPSTAPHSHSPSSPTPISTSPPPPLLDLLDVFLHKATDFLPKTAAATGLPLHPSGPPCLPPDLIPFDPSFLSIYTTARERGLLVIEDLQRLQVVLDRRRMIQVLERARELAAGGAAGGAPVRWRPPR